MPAKHEKLPLLNGKTKIQNSYPAEELMSPLFAKKSSRLAAICLAALIIYTVVGVLFYKEAESLSTFNALYFCVITFTTVGFGDFKPSSDESKIFTCIFVFCGLAVIVSMIAYLLEYLVEKREEHRKQMIQINFDMEDYVETCVHEESNSRDNPMRSMAFIRPFMTNIASDITRASLKIIGILGVGTICYMHVFDHHSPVDALYLSSMTISTVGYGDIAPTNDFSRGFTIFYALIGTTLTASALSTFTGAISALQRGQLEEEVLSTALNLESLALMDSDRNNVVSKDEFVLYKLKVMGLVDNEVIRRAEAQFHRLDITGNGELTTDDVVAFQEKVNVAKSALLKR